jgi:hypothetical protein
MLFDAEAQFQRRRAVSEHPLPHAEKPAGEIEIIPPGVERGRSGSRIWISTGTNRVKVIKLGPIGSFVAALAMLVALALGFIFLTGVFLVLVPIVTVLGAIFYLTGASSDPFRRMR